MQGVLTIEFKGTGVTFHNSTRHSTTMYQLRDISLHVGNPQVTSNGFGGEDLYAAKIRTVTQVSMGAFVSVEAKTKGGESKVWALRRDISANQAGKVGEGMRCDCCDGGFARIETQD